MDAVTIEDTSPFTTGRGNPFAEFDGDFVGSGTLQPGPQPGYAERFIVNMHEGFANTTTGAAILARQPGGTEDDWLAQRYHAWAPKYRAQYEALPQYEGMIEGLVALSGHVVGSLPAIENIVPVGVGGRVVAMAGFKLGGLGARFFAGATDAAIVNAATDPAVQGLQIASGTRDVYEPMQTLISTGIGFAAGGVFGALLRGKTPQGEQPAKTTSADPAAKAAADIGTAAPEPRPTDPAASAAPPASSLPADAAAPTPRAAPTAEPPAPGRVEPATATTAVGEAPGASAPRSMPEPTPERPDAIRAAAEDAAGPDATFGEKMAAEAAMRDGGEAPKRAKRAKASKAEGEAPADLAMRSGPMAGETTRAAAGVAETATEPPAAVRLREVSDRLIEALDPAAVRQGRLPQKAGIEGVYKTGPGVVRVKNTQDFQVLTHELGHHLEVKVGAPLKAWMQANAARLDPLAYAGAAKGAETQEGFAEMARLWVTNPAFLDAQAPGLAADFEAVVKAASPDLLTALGEARAAYADYLAQPSARAVASTIVSAKRPGWVEKTWDAMGDLKGTLAEKFSNAYSALADDLNPIQVTVRRLARTYRDNHGGKLLGLEAFDDPYKLARMARGAYSSGHADINFGVAPYHGTAPVSGSLRDALIEAQGGGNVFTTVNETTLADFGSYLWSRRARGEWDRFARGEIPNPPDKLTRGDHEVNIRELEAANPGFATAAEKVYEWNLALWQKKLDAGLISREQYDNGSKIVDYVPGLRHFDEAEATMAERGAGSRGKGAMVRRFQGSDRDVINPIDSLIADAYQTSMAIARNDAVKALGRLADLAGPGAGRWVERIPAREIRATLVDGADAVERLAKEAGLAGPDIATFRDEVTDLLGGTLPEGFKIFKMGQINEKGEAIVWYREGGELTPLRLADGAEGAKLLGAFDVMTRDETAFLLEFLAKPASYVRLGITTHPTFLIANFVRDQVASTILFGQPFDRLGGSLKGMADDLFGREAAQSYMRVGGISGGASTATLREGQVMKDAAAATMSGLKARTTTLSGLLEMTETAETATRLGNFGIFFDAAKGRGLNDWEASFEAAYRARDVLDFDRRGSRTMAISRIIPFLNASLQGTDKVVRETLVPWAKSMNGDILTAEEQRQLAASGAIVARLGMATVASMGLWALTSQHPDALDVPDRIRATHWVIPFLGDWYVVPKPFEMAAVINIGEHAWDAFWRKDPTAAQRWVSGLYDVLAPPSLLEGNPLLKAAYEVKTGVDFFTGRPVVPEHMKALEPWLQYTHRTSSLGKRLGAAANVSPQWIDHMVTGFSGSWGRSVLALSDWASGEKPAIGWWEAVLNNRFVKDASKGSTSTGAFWDLMSSTTGKLEGALKTYRALGEEGRPGDMAAWLGKQDETTRIYLAASQYPSARGEAVADLHPLVRARNAVTAISALRKDLADDRIETANGPVTLSSMDRRRVDDVLSQLQMGEARNAMIQIGAPGFAKVRQPFDTDALVGELAAMAPEAAQALADRYRTKRVLKKEAVDKAWPDLSERLKRDGTAADVLGLSAIAHAQGFEYGGTRLKPKKKVGVEGQR